MYPKRKKRKFSPPNTPTPAPLASEPFLPSSSIDRFVALRRIGQRNTASEPQPSSRPDRPSSLLEPPPKPPKSGDTANHTKLSSSSPTRTSSTSKPEPGRLQRQQHNTGRAAFPSVSRKLQERIALGSAIESLAGTASSTIATRPYDPLPPPGPDVHRYIASTRLLQNTVLVHALLDAGCGNVQLVDRDFEYLRELLPKELQNRSTARVEADIVLDENTAVLMYPLRDIGQSSLQDPDAGLNELIRTLARIGPRYKIIWLIFEEYSWSSHSLSTASIIRSNSRGPLTSWTAPSTVQNPIDSTSSHGRIARLDPYAGPVAVQLNKLMAWLPFTHDQQRWLTRLSHGQPSHVAHHQGVSQDLFSLALSLISKLNFETCVLFASDERCAAWMTRAIADKIVFGIEKETRIGIRRDEDGWQDREEWIWREWLNDQDSTHERFLASFQLFNPFSVQLILSICSLKEFMAMDNRQRVETLGKFIDPKVMAVFDRIITTPLS